jgi:hypothetical protein
LKFWHSIPPPFSLLSKQTGLPTILEPEDLPAKTTRGTQGLILVLDFITVIEISWLDFPHASLITVLQVDHTVNQGNLGGTILRAQFDVIANDSE